MEQIKLFQDTVCEVMNLVGGKCLVRESKGEELEVYEFELSPIPLSKELLEILGFRFDKVDYTIKGWECYKLTKINRVYFTLGIFIESKELTPPIGYVATEDVSDASESLFSRITNAKEKLKPDFVVRT